MLGSPCTERAPAAWRLWPEVSEDDCTPSLSPPHPSWAEVTEQRIPFHLLRLSHYHSLPRIHCHVDTDASASGVPASLGPEPTQLGVFFQLCSGGPSRPQEEETCPGWHRAVRGAAGIRTQVCWLSGPWSSPDSAPWTAMGKLSREVSLVQADAHQALGSTHSSCICIYLHAGLRGLGYRPQNRLISATNQWAQSCRILSTKVKGAPDLKMIHLITSWVSRANPELAQPPTISPSRSEVGHLRAKELFNSLE